MCDHSPGHSGLGFTDGLSGCDSEMGSGVSSGIGSVSRYCAGVDAGTTAGSGEDAGTAVAWVRVVVLAWA